MLTFTNISFVILLVVAVVSLYLAVYYKRETEHGKIRDNTNAKIMEDLRKMIDTLQAEKATLEEQLTKVRDEANQMIGVMTKKIDELRKLVLAKRKKGGSTTKDGGKDGHALAVNTDTTGSGGNQAHQNPSAASK